MRTWEEIIKYRAQLYEQWERLPDEDDAEDDIEMWNSIAAQSKISGMIDALDWVIEYDYIPKERGRVECEACEGTGWLKKDRKKE